MITKKQQEISICFVHFNYLKNKKNVFYVRKSIELNIDSYENNQLKLFEISWNILDI